MMHQIESSRHSSLLQYSETIVDESFDYDKKKDQAFLGTVGRIVLNPDKSDLASAAFDSGSTEVFLDITKYGILYDMVMVCDLQITTSTGLSAQPKWDPTHTVYDLFDIFELRTRSGHVLYERRPWTYMQEFKKCSFRRYKELVVHNMVRPKLSINSTDFTTYNVEAPSATGSETKHRIFVPLYFDWFKILAKCPDVMSLEDLVLVVRTKSQDEIGSLFNLTANADSNKGTPTVKFKKVYLRQYYIQPPQARYNAIVQSLHPGGQPHNNMTTSQFFERVLYKPLTVPYTFTNPGGINIQWNTIQNATTTYNAIKALASSDAVRGTAAIDALSFEQEIHCQFPVYRTFIRAYWKGDAHVYNGRRVYGIITQLKCKEAGQVFYEIASGFDSSAAGNSNVVGLYETDILQEYDHGETSDEKDAYLLTKHHERMVTINWSMAHLLPEQGQSKTALSFYQMSNPTIEFVVEFASGEIPVNAEGLTYVIPGVDADAAVNLANAAAVKTTYDTKLAAGQPGKVFVEIVHEYMCVFQTQASANMRNRSIRRMATK